MRRHVLRFDRWRHHLKDVIVVCDLGVLFVVATRSRASATLQIRCMWRTRTGLECQSPQLERDVAACCATATEDRFWGRSDCRFHHVAPDEYHLALDARATFGVDVARFGQENHHSKLFERAKRRFVHVHRFVV